MRRTTAIAILMTLLLTLSAIIATAAAATTPSAEYQRRTPLALTPGAGGGRSGDSAATLHAEATNLAATLGIGGSDAISTVQAEATHIALTLGVGGDALRATAQAGGTSAASTLQAGSVNVEATVQAGATNIAATVQYVSTSVNLDLQTLGGTATAIAGDWQAFLGSLAPEVAAALEALIANNSVVYDAATQSLVITAYFDEASVNTLLDASMAAAGYDPETVSVNITSTDVQVMIVEGQTTTVFIYQVSAVEGEVVWTLVAVTVNGRSVPLDSLPEDVQADVATGLDTALISAELAATLATLNEFYAVETVTLTETGAVVVVSVPLTLE